MSERIERLKAVVESACGCKATHVETNPVIERFNGEVVWEGIVESFALEGHPNAKHCYAFMLIENEQPMLKTVLEVPPVDSPLNAVRAAIMARELSNAGPGAQSDR